jgi:hypothetical protein
LSMPPSPNKSAAVLTSLSNSSSISFEIFIGLYLM